MLFQSQNATAGSAGGDGQADSTAARRSRLREATLNY
jgi:hypothetical protein